MTLTQLIPFYAILLPMAALPGPGVVTVVSYGLHPRDASGAALILGISLGDCLYLVLSILGASRLLVLYPQVSLLLRLTGAAYLCAAGCFALNQPPARTTWQTSGVSRNPVAALLTGLSISLSNPGVMLFYLGIMPLVLDLHSVRGWEVLTLTLSVMVLLWIILGIYYYLASTLKRWLQRPGISRMTEQAGGLLLLISGLWIFLG